MPARKRGAKRQVKSAKIAGVILIEPTGDRRTPWLVNPRDVGFDVTYRARDREEAWQTACELIAAAAKEGKKAVAKFADSPPHDRAWGGASAGEMG